MIGTDITVELLLEIFRSSIGSITLPVIIGYLDKAKFAGFIDSDPVNPRIYNFLDENGKNVAYSRLLYSHRTNLHIKIANIYEGWLMTNSDQPYNNIIYEKLVYHWNCVLESTLAFDDRVDQLALRNYVKYLHLLGRSDVALEKLHLLPDPAERDNLKRSLTISASSSDITE